MAITLQTSNNDIINQNMHLLNAWPTIMMESVWHFNQAAGIGAPLQTSNDQAGKVYLQKEREYIARHLESCAMRMAGDLNYTIAPYYFSEQIPLGTGIPIQRQTFQGRWCKLQALGKRGQTLIQAGVNVAYSDPHGIGVADTAMVTVNTTVANSEVKLYFRTADGAPTAGDVRYEIEPLVVTNNGAGVVTLTGHRALFVKPSEWAQEYADNDPNFNSPNIVDTAQAAGFVTAVDVYRVYTDTSANIILESNDGTVLQTFTGDVLDTELSVFRMGDLCSTVCWDKRPARITVNYLAGSPLSAAGYIDSELYEACAAYASGKMMSRLSGMSYWTLDLYDKWHRPMVDSQLNVPIATRTQTDSKYGARTGEVYAWDVVTDRRVYKGHKLTTNMRH